MALPPLTPEARAAALEKAAIARKDRADLKGQLKRGETSLTDVLYTYGDTVGKMKVSALLEAMPGVGKIRAKQIMDRLEISETRRIRGLGDRQREALEQEFAPAFA